MPHFINHNTLLVVTKDELIDENNPALWNTWEGLKSAINTDMKREYGLNKVQSGGRGRQVLIEYDSLPDHVKDVIPDPREGMHILEYYYEVDLKAVEFFSLKANGYTDDEKLNRDINNASILNACECLLHDREIEIRNKGGKVKKKWQTICNDVVTFTPVLKKKFAGTHNLPKEYISFQRKYLAYIAARSEDIYKGYEIIKHGGTKNTNRLKVNDETLDLLKAIFRGWGKKPNYKDVKDYYDSFLKGEFEVIKSTDTGEMYLAENFKPLGRSTIYNWLSKWDTKIGTDAVAAGDRQALKGKYIPHYSMEREMFAGSILSVDDRQPPFYYTKEKDRMWAYLAQDVASQAITVWVFGETKDGIIIEFYRQMVRNYHKWGLNLPYELECESALNSTFRKGLLKPGNMFQRVRVEKNNARGKYIESGYNRNVRYNKDLEKGDKGWVARPFAKDEANQLSDEKIPVIKKPELIVKCMQNIETYNNTEHPHEKGISRWDYFLKHQHEDLKPINWRGILPYIGHTPRNGKNPICKAGIVNFDNQEWLLAEDGAILIGDALIEVMKDVEGEQLSVYWLDDEYGDVIKAIAYIDNTYMCELMPIPKGKRSTLETTPEHKAARELMKAYEGTIQDFQNEQRASVRKVVVLDNRKVTLNNNFQILPREETDPFIEFEQEAKVLPDPEEEIEYEYSETEFSTDTKNRF